MSRADRGRHREGRARQDRGDRHLKRAKRSVAIHDWVTFTFEKVTAPLATVTSAGLAATTASSFGGVGASLLGITAAGAVALTGRAAAKGSAKALDAAGFSPTATASAGAHGSVQSVRNHTWAALSGIGDGRRALATLRSTMDMLCGRLDTELGSSANDHTTAARESLAEARTRLAEADRMIQWAHTRGRAWVEGL